MAQIDLLSSVRQRTSTLHILRVLPSLTISDFAISLDPFALLIKLILNSTDKGSILVSIREHAAKPAELSASVAINPP